MRCEAVLREVIEEMNIPTPSRMKRPVYKEERCGVCAVARVLGEEF
jgi:hypothetical protein